MKNFRLPGLSAGRDSSFQVRLEMFNAFNWVNLNNPTSNVNSTNFGRVTTSRGNGAVGGPRVVQLGFKWMF